MKEEKQLIVRLQRKDSREAAFKELISLYKKRLYWHIRKIIISHEDTDDVLQDTFIKIYKNIASFKGNSKLYSWMYRIATNEALSFLKRNSKHQQHRLNEVANDFAINNLTSDIYFEGNDIQLKLQQAIATLPQKQRLVFNMRYFDNIKYKDISDILETSEGALKASYHIAVKKIEQHLINN
ncbi:RNA polymerase sigma factor [Flavobacteriaceae bacterium]|nr:RNA polymerase sigma factor [Bacteroidota bacterium]MDC0957359.1 RNA polymerase sigma factor [Flavobacteriaceae bacterium]MDC1051741.1 RNA polymerase sigma factor [Flavobacteriaceae bacterium]MDC3242186.1 RNA polymerase sigma factor [Flavobacteriaceae bacterium]MDG1379697.1 RNA polymerase sigma factor [Flavobacteriaceae bacterium]